MSGNIRQCINCKKLFQAYDNPTCPECSDKLDTAFKQVRDYLYEHPRADILEISKNTGVPEKWIFNFLKEERLSLETGSILLTCEQCGAPITSGRFCKNCKNHLEKIINTADMNLRKAKQEAEKDILSFKRPIKMHIDVKE